MGACGGKGEEEEAEEREKDGDPIRADGEQARADTTCPILRIPHSRRKASP